jgi:hypothetical protein
LLSLPFSIEITLPSKFFAGVVVPAITPDTLAVTVVASKVLGIFSIEVGSKVIVFTVVSSALTVMVHSVDLISLVAPEPSGLVGATVPA